MPVDTPAAGAIAPASDPAVPVKGPLRTKSDFDQSLANDIADAGKLLTQALATPAVLAELSYPEAEIQEGVALQTDAQAKFSQRQEQLGTAGQKLAARDVLLAEVKEDFSAYRQTVQANFEGTDRVALAGSGKVPLDVQKFTTLVRSAYQTAQRAPYAAVLAKRKLPAATLLARLERVDELEKLDGEFSAADAAIVVATQARNAAGKTLRTWISRFRKQARADLRKRPDLLAELDL